MSLAKATVLTKSAKEPVLDAHFASGWVGKRTWACLASHDRGGPTFAVRMTGSATGYEEEQGSELPCPSFSPEKPWLNS
jgi:hypothetical protein